MAMTALTHSVRAHLLAGYAIALLLLGLTAIGAVTATGAVTHEFIQAVQTDGPLMQDVLRRGSAGRNPPSLPRRQGHPHPLPASRNRGQANGFLMRTALPLIASSTTSRPIRTLTSRQACGPSRRSTWCSPRSWAARSSFWR